MARLFKFAVFISYLTFLAINIGVALLLIQTLFSKLANASEGSFLKIGTEVASKEYKSNLLAAGYQGKTDFFLSYQVELGIISEADKQGKIDKGYGSGSLGVDVGTTAFAKGFLGVGVDTLTRINLNQDFELGLRDSGGASISLFILRNSTFKILSLPPSRDFIGAKVQIPI